MRRIAVLALALVFGALLEGPVFADMGAGVSPGKGQGPGILWIFLVGAVVCVWILVRYFGGQGKK